MNSNDPNYINYSRKDYMGRDCAHANHNSAVDICSATLQVSAGKPSP